MLSPMPISSQPLENYIRAVPDNLTRSFPEDHPFVGKHISVLRGIKSYAPKEVRAKPLSPPLFLYQFYKTALMMPIIDNLHMYKGGESERASLPISTFIYLEALKAGINKDSIKKLWAVGPFTDQRSLNSRFTKNGISPVTYRVATAIKSSMGWVVLDPLHSDGLVTMEDWYKAMASYHKTPSPDGVWNSGEFLFFPTAPYRASIFSEKGYIINNEVGEPYYELWRDYFESPANDYEAIYKDGGIYLPFGTWPHETKEGFTVWKR